MYSRTAEVLAENGIASLRIDFRGSGESIDEIGFEETTFSGQVSDALAAVEWLDGHEGIGDIGVRGLSQGGLVGSITAAVDARVSSLVLWSPVANPVDTYKTVLGADAVLQGLTQPATEATLPWGAVVTLNQPFYQELYAIDPVAAISHYEGPLQVVVGERDDVVTPQPYYGETYLNRTGSRGDSDDRFQAASVASCWSAQYAASYSAGGMSPQAPWSRWAFHQWTQAAVSNSTCSTLRLVEPIDGFREGIVIGVALRSHRVHGPGVLEALGVTDGEVLGGFNRSSQHPAMEEVRDGCQRASAGDPCDAGQIRSPGRPSTARREDRVRFWKAIARGSSSEDAAREAGVSPAVGSRWFRQAGGMPPIRLAPVSEHYLSFAEREEIAILHAQDLGVRGIARGLGGSPSTISRELRRNASTRSHAVAYRATTAQWHADRRASRPKVSKLAANDTLREYVQDRLAGMIAGPDRVMVPGPQVKWVGRRHGPRADRQWATAWSPEQISNRLRIDFPDDASMRISHEAIYQALYVQGRGALERELVACLRTGRSLRVPRARSGGRGKTLVRPEIMISERPAEADDRAVPGHWEGDLILGLDSSAVGTLVERTTRFTLLLRLPRMQGHGERRPLKNGPALAGHGAEAVRDAIAASITTLPEQLRRSLTWDQGAEMAQHAQLRIDTDLDIYFCDPQSPWQRGTNENTNGLLRQYFPKGTDLSRHSRGDLDAVSAALNSRPRKTLGWKTPAEVLDEHLHSLEQGSVATTS